MTDSPTVTEAREALLGELEAEGGWKPWHLSRRIEALILAHLRAEQARPAEPPSPYAAILAFEKHSDRASTMAERAAIAFAVKTLDAGSGGSAGPATREDAVGGASNDAAHVYPAQPPEPVHHQPEKCPTCLMRGRASNCPDCNGTGLRIPSTAVVEAGKGEPSDEELQRIWHRAGQSVAGTMPVALAGNRALYEAGRAAERAHWERIRDTPIETLIARSSLGGPRPAVDPAIVERVLRRADELAEQSAPPEQRGDESPAVELERAETLLEMLDGVTDFRQRRITVAAFIASALSSKHGGGQAGEARTLAAAEVFEYLERLHIVATDMTDSVDSGDRARIALDAETLRKTVRCSTSNCENYGMVLTAGMIVCGACRLGMEAPALENPPAPVGTKCGNCYGSGAIVTYPQGSRPCPDCKGAGQAPEGGTEIPPLTNEIKASVSRRVADRIEARDPATAARLREIADEIEPAAATDEDGARRTMNQFHALAPAFLRPDWSQVGEAWINAFRFARDIGRRERGGEVAALVLSLENQTQATADATRMYGEQRERAEKAEAKAAQLEADLLIARSSVGYGKLEGEIETLKVSREKAWALLRELGVTVMP